MTFVIHTHQRLQEWVAEEHGYFAAEGLTEYVLARNDLGWTGTALSAPNAASSSALTSRTRRDGKRR